MNEESRSDPKRGKQPRPSGDMADKALQEVIQEERERGEVNTGAEPDQKSEVQKHQDGD
jgi:hypothetical protein